MVLQVITDIENGNNKRFRVLEKMLKDKKEERSDVLFPEVPVTW